MGAMPNEPSMEEILSSIKRIIADEDRGQGDRGHGMRAPRRAAAPLPQLAPPPETVAQDAVDPVDIMVDETILELTNALPDDPASLEEPMSEPAAPAPEARSRPSDAKPAEPRRAPAEPRSERRAPTRDQAAASQSDAAKAAAIATVLSDSSARAARDSLDHLSKLLVRNEDGQSNTLEGLVRELLRPMLKDWLDAHLPELVESLVKREIDRISGRV
jgi:cell pole-organizing protein PopZ